MVSSTAQKTVSYKTDAGEIVATVEDHVISAKGVPYAVAKRFEAPRSVTFQTTPYIASNPAPACPQLAVPELDELLGIKAPSLPHDENCLNLSITRPAEDSNNERAVMVWLHGGSYVVGAGDTDVFDVKPLCVEQDVIVVAVTYRLGVFGFLGGYASRPANLGLLDMIEALRWVKANIASFGGDPNNITVFGESAGGDAIAHLMISDGTQGLFQRAIIQSAPLGIRNNRQEMHQAMGDIASQIDPQDPIEHVLEIQKKVILKGNQFGLNGGMPFSPQYGHYPLPEESNAETEWRARAKDVDLLIGFNEEETALYLHLLPKLQRMTKLPLVGRFLGKLIVRSTTRKIYGKPAITFAKQHSKAGGKAAHYVLNWGKGKTPFGACHTVDLPLLFGHYQTWKDAKIIEGLEEKTVERDGPLVRALWANFARTGRLKTKNGKISGVLKWKTD